MFKRLTPQQRDTLAALKALGELTVTPRDARQLRALRRRGLVRYRRVDGIRIAVLVASTRSRRAKAREARWINRVWEYMHKLEAAK